MVAWAPVLAVADEASDASLGLAEYGILGFFAALLIWFARVSYKRETDRSDRLEAEVVRLNNMIIEKVIPALSSATNAVEDATELLKAMQRERELGLIRERDLMSRSRPGEPT